MYNFQNKRHQGCKTQASTSKSNKKRAKNYFFNIFSRTIKIYQLMSRQKLPMNRIFADELFILNKNKSSGCYYHPKKHHIKQPNNATNQTKSMTIQDRHDMILKKTYNNIKAFKHSNCHLHRTIQHLKLSNSTINPGNASFQNQDLFAVNAPQFYKAFPKRESPLKNNNPAKFFMTQNKKSSKKKLQQSSILQMYSKRYILASPSFSNSRQIDDKKKIKLPHSQRRNNIHTIDHDLSTETIVLQQTISLMRLPKSKNKKIQIKSLIRPKTSVYNNKNINHCYRKDNIEPWQSYIQCDQSDVEQISQKN